MNGWKPTQAFKKQKHQTLLEIFRSAILSKKRVSKNTLFLVIEKLLGNSVKLRHNSDGILQFVVEKKDAPGVKYRISNREVETLEHIEWESTQMLMLSDAHRKNGYLVAKATNVSLLSLIACLVQD